MKRVNITFSPIVSKSSKVRYYILSICNHGLSIPLRNKQARFLSSSIPQENIPPKSKFKLGAGLTLAGLATILGAGSYFLFQKYDITTDKSPILKSMNINEISSKGLSISNETFDNLNSETKHVAPVKEEEVPKDLNFILEESKSLNSGDSLISNQTHAEEELEKQINESKSLNTGDSLISHQTHADKELEKQMNESKSLNSDDSLISHQTHADKELEKQVNDRQEIIEEKSRQDIDEILSSDYPIIPSAAEQEEEQNNYDKEKALTNDIISNYLVTKDKLLHHLHLQRIEIENVINEPENTLANKSLQGLENEYNSLLSDYKFAKDNAYESLYNLRSLNTNVHVIDELRRKIELEDEEVSQEISNLTAEKKQNYERPVEDETKSLINQIIVSHHDLMSSKLNEQAEKLNTAWENKLNDILNNASVEQKLNNAKLQAKFEGIESGLNASQSVLTELKRFQIVRNMIDELFEFIDHPTPEVKKIYIKCQVESLQRLLKDSTLSDMLHHIPRRILIHGLPSQHSLIEDFIRIEHNCLKWAYVQPGDGLLSHIVSYLRYLVPFQSSPRLDIPRDLEKRAYDNVTMLKCARQCVDRGDIFNATRILNNLKGVPSEEATGWVLEARAYLETKQVIEILYWYIVTITLTATNN